MIVDSLWIGVILCIFVDCNRNAIDIEQSQSTRVRSCIFAILVGVCIGLEIYKIAEKVSDEHKHDLKDRIVELEKRIKELENKEN
jgi:hypothetical protein